jgi:hypothetical protein
MLGEAQHTKALLELERVCALFSLEIPRDLSGKHLRNQSLKRLGMISILFTIRDHIESKLVP